MKKNNNRKIIIISSIILILVIILIVLNRTLKKQDEKQALINTVNSYTSISDFKTIEEVAIYLDCDYIKMSNSKDKNYTADIYLQIKYDLYSNDQSNEVFYKRLVLYCANVLKYKSFRILDTKKNITIEVDCNKDNETINKIIINGEESYFQKTDSLLELKKIDTVQESNFDIQSKILQEIIRKKWSKNINFGSKDSEFNRYDIYFEEGIEVRNIEDKIFNIIFTSNYKENIVNNINANSSQDEIIKALGEPTYKDEQYGIIGYKTKDFYMFYNAQSEISIYRIDNEYNSDTFANLIDEYFENKDFENLIKNVKNNYKDFDKYSNDADGIILKYTLKGLEIILNKKTSNEIIFYNNYSGKIYKDLYIKDISTNIPDNILIKNENLVFNAEVERLMNKYLEEYNAGIDKLNNENKSYSNKFYTIKEELSSNTYAIKFISIDNTSSNSELRENINYYIWIDDYNFVYSITGKGLYVYNAKTKKYGTLIEGQEKFELKEYSNNILKYDDKSVKLKN